MTVPAFTASLDRFASRLPPRVDRVHTGAVDRVFEEITVGGTYSQGTPVGSTGRTRAAWERTDDGVQSTLSHPWFHVLLLELGLEGHGGEAFVRLAVAAGQPIVDEVVERVNAAAS
jgi:hypothetical protein